MLGVGLLAQGHPKPQAGLIALIKTPNKSYTHKTPTWGKPNHTRTNN
ncbi:hypothetical protein [Vulcanisaeta thermophila]|nr:hypothetical protein [Vulcanisaeta thermophila]